MPHGYQWSQNLHLSNQMVRTRLGIWKKLRDETISAELYATRISVVTEPASK